MTICVSEKLYRYYRFALKSADPVWLDKKIRKYNKNFSGDPAERLNAVRCILNRYLNMDTQIQKPIAKIESISDYRFFPAKAKIEAILADYFWFGKYRSVSNLSISWIMHNDAIKPVGALVDFMKAHDICALPYEILATIQTLVDQLNEPEISKAYNQKAEKGIVIYGPPGTGKTRLAMAISEYLFNKHTNKGVKTETLIILGPSILQSYVGQTEQSIRELFDKARENPTTHFFVIIDEVDSLFPIRSDHDHHWIQTMVSTFLTNMDGPKAPENITIIGTTNRLESMDPAALRPGRFGYHMSLDLPNEQQRKELYEHYARKLKVYADWSKCYKEEISGGFSQAQIQAHVNEAARIAFARVVALKAKRKQNNNDLLNSKQAKVKDSDFILALPIIRQDHLS